MPPELSAIAPPTVHRKLLAGSGGKKNPSFRSASLRSSSTTPACTWTYQFTGSIFRIRLKRCMSRMIAPSRTTAPVRLVPAPRATTGTRRRVATSRIPDLLLGRGAGYDRRGSLEVRHVLPESLEGTGLCEDVFRSDDRTQFRGQPENTRTRGHRGQ